MGKFIQQFLRLIHFSDFLTCIQCCACLIQTVFQIFRLRKTCRHTAGTRTVGHISCNRQIGIVHLRLKIFKGFLPDLLRMLQIIVIVPEKCGKLEKSHLVRFCKTGRIGHCSRQACHPVSRIMCNIAKINTGRSMLIDRIIQPEYRFMISPASEKINGLLSDRRIYVRTGPVDIYIFTQIL